MTSRGGLPALQDLTLNQKTPLRVLHRRTLAVRQRLVHSMSTSLVDPHHFHLSLKTQAGTYPPHRTLSSCFEALSLCVLNAS